MKFVETGAGRGSGRQAIAGPAQDDSRDLQHNPLRTCMVGDRLSTDIEFGKRGGLHTLLVLSGVTHESDLTTIEDPTQIPDFVVDSVDAINEFYRETTEEQ